MMLVGITVGISNTIAVYTAFLDEVLVGIFRFKYANSKDTIQFLQNIQ